MAKHSVDVLVKARDHASRTFAIVGSSAVVMGKALKGAAHIAGATLSMAFQAAKRAAMGLAAAFAYSSYAAMKQEDAELGLKGVLIGLGTYTKELMEDYKQFASAMQEATTWGDEYVLSLLQVAAAQTDSSKAAKELVSDTLALINIVPAGKMKPLSFMKMVAGYKKGLPDLDSYLIALKGVTDESERQRIYAEALAAGWGLMGEKITTATSALKRAWNAIGDVTEVIGKPFLIDIKNSAVAVKKWAQDNQAYIGWWAERVHIHVTLAKDIFMSFVDYMKEDWKSGLAFAFDGFIELLKATMATAVILAIAGGKGIWKGVKEGLLGTKEGRIKIRAGEIYEKEYSGEKPWNESVYGSPIGGSTVIRDPNNPKLYAEAMAKATIEENKRVVQSIMGDSKAMIKETWSTAMKTIKDSMPEEMRKSIDIAFAEHAARLAALGARPGPNLPSSTNGEGDGGSGGGIAKQVMQNSGLAAIESRFMKMPPGQRNQQALVSMAKERNRKIDATNKILAEINRRAKNPARAILQDLDLYNVTDFGM